MEIRVGTSDKELEEIACSHQINDTNDAKEL